MTADDTSMPEGAGRPALRRQLGKLLTSGRISEEEARAIETANDDATMDSALVSIRSRHARQSLGAAVAGGSLSQQEADELLARVERGEHSRGLRSHISKLRSRSRRTSSDKHAR